MLVVGLLGLVACGGDEVTTDPTPIQSPSTPVSSPSESESTEPETELWQEKSKAGAKAFVDHWLEALYVAQSTGDVGPLQEVSHRSCNGCKAYIDVAKEIYGAGGFFDSKPWTAPNKEFDKHLSGDERRIVCDVRIPKATEADSESAPRKTHPPSRRQFAATMHWIDARWVMWEWEFIA